MPRGGRPVPTKILRLRNSRVVKTRPHEPQPTAERPPCPDWLSPEAKSVWRQVVGQLHAIGLLTRIDGQALARYVVMAAQWRQATEFLQANGTSYDVRDGKGAVLGYRLYPQARLVVMLQAELLKLEQSFGMNPSARAHLHVEKPTAPEVDPKAHFFRTPG